MNFSSRRAVGLAVAFFLIGDVALPQELENFPKLQWFEQHKDEFDIVFVGSSRIYHGVSPKLFDQITAQSGHHWRSFNLGKDGMVQGECLAVVRQIVALHPQKLRYVFFEIQGSGTSIPKRAAERANSKPLSYAGRYGGLGPDGDGYFPMGKSMTPAVQERYRGFLKAAQESPDPHPADSSARETLGHFCEELGSENVRIIFVEAPSLRSAHGSSVNAPAGIPLFSFSDTVRYAALYDEKNRMDAEHLNARGAEVFSRALANEFVAMLDSRTR
ncbi:MAG: hypothetical protein H0X40_17800 [Chthoniobacterales bacterium]|nr:hypothetical protein [Chthoniobacterales bacterium]